MSQCKSCNERIIWGRTERGKGVPLNPVPSLDGELVATGEYSHSGEVIVIPKRRPSDKDSLRYVNHFSTCTSPDQSRANG